LFPVPGAVCLGGADRFTRTSMGKIPALFFSQNTRYSRFRARLEVAMSIGFRTFPFGVGKAGLSTPHSRVVLIPVRVVTITIYAPSLRGVSPPPRKCYLPLSVSTVPLRPPPPLFLSALAGYSSTATIIEFVASFFARYYPFPGVFTQSFSWTALYVSKLFFPDCPPCCYDSISAECVPEANLPCVRVFFYVLELPFPQHYLFPAGICGFTGPSCVSFPLRLRL